MSNIEPSGSPEAEGGEDSDFDLEPEIKRELDHLNQCSAEINRLENEIDEARTKYRQTFHEASNRMSVVAQKRRKSIAKAREYFELKEEAKTIHGESLKAARQYQSSIGIYRAAKETVALAEDRLVKGGEVQLSSAWQEMLNHATIRVMDAEMEKRRSEDQHLKMTTRCGQIEQRLHVLERTKKRAIGNARCYFELKNQLDLKLQQQKQNVTDLQCAIKQAKAKYSKSLRKLEEISLAIHEARRNKLLLMYPRQPGVGAECDSLCSSLSEITLGSLGNDSNSFESDVNYIDTDDEDEDCIDNEQVDNENDRIGEKLETANKPEFLIENNFHEDAAASAGSACSIFNKEETIRNDDKTLVNEDNDDDYGEQTDTSSSVNN